MPKNLLRITLLLVGFASFNASALMINWTDWQSSTPGTSSGTTGITVFGTITSGTETINVTYENPRGVGFIQTGTGTDYFQNSRSGRDPATSPYTSEGPNGVDNIPPAAEMIALQFEGVQTLTFSQPIANPYFAYISLNRNGYGFDQDFDLLSNTGSNLDGSANGPDDNGYWGCGTSIKELPAPNVFELNIAPTGQTCGPEPHGVLRFTGAFSQVSWNSLSDEFWNGFTLGVQGTAAQVFPCQVDPTLPQCQMMPPSDLPEPGTIALIVLGLAGLRRSLVKRH